MNKNMNRNTTLADTGKPRISLLGTTAVLFEAPGAFDLVHQRRIWALAERAGEWPEVGEAVPGMTNLTLMLKEPPGDIDALFDRLYAGWSSGEEKHPDARRLDIPVTYGSKGGPHLADVAAGTGLSVAEVVRLHCEPDYTVYAIGSHAGYCYLGGLNPKLFIPRRKVPLVSIPGGSLSVAGMQTGVSASAGPSGWHTIGHADIAFFDPARQPPALLRPGDIIRFTVKGILS